MSHRPSEETLAAFASGALDEGLSLVVGAHVERSAATAARLRAIERLRGALLEEAQPAPLDPAARDRALARLGDAPRRVANSPVPPRAPEEGLPAVLAPYALGKWRALGRGIELRRVEVPGAEARVFLLRARPGIWLPAHRHTGAEWTTILSGAYEHEYGRFAAGDFDEADARHHHAPRVDPVEGCACIVALSGRVLFDGWLGRLLQPLVRL